MTVLLAKALPRRAMLQALLAVPAFSFYRTVAPPEPAAPPLMDDDAIVEVGGWILKRSDLA